MAGDRLTKINEIKAMKQELKTAKETISKSSEENANLKSELEVQQNIVKILKAQKVVKVVNVGKSEVEMVSYKCDYVADDENGLTSHKKTTHGIKWHMC